MAEVAVYQPGKHELQQINQTHLQQNSPFLNTGLFLCEAAKINKSRARWFAVGSLIQRYIRRKMHSTNFCAFGEFFVGIIENIILSQNFQSRNEGGAGNAPAAPDQSVEMLVPV